MDKGLNAKQIAEHFTTLGRQISGEAIRLRINRIRSKDEERARFLLPWRVKSPEHTQGWVYTAVRAYAKWQKGAGLTPYELDQARQLDEYLKSRDAVLTYDHASGFTIRSRRPGDGPSALVA
jgi:hypothetical protein